MLQRQNQTKLAEHTEAHANCNMTEQGYINFIR